MYDILCTYPLRSDLFTLSIHPTDPLLALGLASGRVQLTRLPPSANQSSGSPRSKSANPSVNGHATISTLWQTHRHRGSCRALTFSHDGRHIFSAGSDGLVKFADTETGKVIAKIAIPLVENKIDAPTCLGHLNRQTLALATDSRALYIYDIRGGNVTNCQGAKPTKTWNNVHADFVTSISPLASASGDGESKQFITTGAGTVAIIDVRKGILLETDDSDEQILSSAVCAGKVIVGNEHGKLRHWNVGDWDNEAAINVEKGTGASLDVLATTKGDDSEGGLLGIGREDGTLRLAEVAPGKVKNRVKVRDECLKHDDLDGVSGLGWVSDGRLITGGGSTVKIWEERESIEEDGDVESNEDAERAESEEEGDSSHRNEEEDSEEERPKKKRRKRNRKGPTKQTNGIMRFSGLA